MHQEKFLEYLRVEKRYSERTLVSYGTDLRQFKVYLKDFFETEEITDVNHMMIRSWIVELIENEISTKSVNRKIATLNTYYKFLLKEQTFFIRLTKIFTLSGKLVQEGEVSNDNSEIYVGGLCSGVHALRIGELTAKFVVE